ncbi:MAG: family 10 glycosylhydrolase [Clostridium sp.]|nr:family 10 glycosylhydrolase [Prevotella sp.]MCM1429357.1 family 10 glycosylhydrolase [Clostridium sp.]MCM1475608.1 family 10 glycosylhydrolase [Muribaculaceae bacterium]
MKSFKFLIFLFLSFCSVSVALAQNPKREFRGAWLHVIGQSQWQNKSTAQAQEYIRQQFDKLQAAGCNAVIFQVRPTADAVYKSAYEPWSAWLTGRRGKAPNPEWDPMEFAIAEAHKRGMEFHAWLNPYRVTSTAKEVLPADHDSKKEPHRFFRYNGQVLFDPAYQENRDFICMIVEDITKRYDVDAIHIDDYFYPYPAAGQKLPDDASYAKFGNGMNRNDWRRHNVDLLIEQLHKTIKRTKPWVRFGISPFGIWRNKKSDPKGSNSNGLQNYDDLYADILLWDKKGWVDYLVPQLYWSLDTKAAPSRHLVQWWNDNIVKADLYIGQDTKRTMDSADPGNHDRNELDTKVRLSRMLPRVGGNVWWHGYWVTDNYKGVADSLALKYQSTIALPPAYGDDNKRPDPVSNIQVVREGGKTFLTWTSPAIGSREKETDAVKFVVYEFFPDENPNDISDPQTIIAVTPLNRVLISDDSNPNSVKGLTFVVTSLDRMNRESKPVKLKL